ncbi:MAG: DUF2281 domain-containing protein [Thermoproteota archaeon]
MERAYELLKKLPEDLKQEVVNYMKFLLERRVKSRGEKSGLTWRGALKELKDKYTSAELQHKGL